MSAAEYRPDRAGMRALANSPDVERAVRQATERGARWAQGNSPVDSGDFAGSFRVESGTNGGWDGRAWAHLINDSDHAAAVEFGNRGRDGHRILARAVDVIQGGS